MVKRGTGTSRWNDIAHWMGSSLLNGSLVIGYERAMQIEAAIRNKYPRKVPLVNTDSSHRVLIVTNPRRPSIMAINFLLLSLSPKKSQESGATKMMLLPTMRPPRDAGDRERPAF